MKFLFGVYLLTLGLNVMANETYQCDFLGPNYELSIDDLGGITLKNNFKTYQCKKGHVNFPGTEVELVVLNCFGHNKMMTFYYAVNGDGDIILSKDLGISKDITCKKN